MTRSRSLSLRRRSFLVQSPDEIIGAIAGAIVAIWLVSMFENCLVIPAFATVDRAVAHIPPAPYTLSNLFYARFYVPVSPAILVLEGTGLAAAALFSEGADRTFKMRLMGGLSLLWLVGYVLKSRASWTTPDAFGAFGAVAEALRFALTSLLIVAGAWFGAMAFVGLVRRFPR